MGWKVMFWNIQGTARENEKLERVIAVIALVDPDIIGFAEVGLGFPYELLPGYEFKEETILDKNGKPTPKGLALGVKRCNHLAFTSELAHVQRTIQTSDDRVDLTRPILHAWVNDVEVILSHAPSTSGGPLGRSTIANVYDYLRDQCRLSRGSYKGFAIGDYNAVYSPYLLTVDEDYIEVDHLRRLRRKSSYRYLIRSCNPGWDMTQKSGGVLDYMITCGLVGMTLSEDHEQIKNLNMGDVLDEPAKIKWKKSVTRSGERWDVVEADPSLDSVYSLVKGSLDARFVVNEKPIWRPSWRIDHRPVIYELLNAERGAFLPLVTQQHIDNPRPL